MSVLRPSDLEPSPLVVYREWRDACAWHEWAAAALRGEVSAAGHDPVTAAHEAYADVLYWGRLMERQRLRAALVLAALLAGLTVLKLTLVG